MMRKFALALAVVVLAGVAGRPAHATGSMTMAQLLAGGELVCGDKIFKNFTNFVTFATGGAVAPTADEILVTCIFTDTDAPGLLFQSALWNVTSGQTMDTTFEFDVYVAPGSNNFISGVEMRLAGFGISRTGNIIGTETVTGIGGAPLLASLLTDAKNGPIIDSASIPLSKAIHVVKDLALFGGSNGRASISNFQQRYKQIIPEPSSVILLGMGLTALVGYQWRRRKAS